MSGLAVGKGFKLSQGVARTKVVWRPDSGALGLCVHCRLGARFGGFGVFLTLQARAALNKRILFRKS